MTFFDDLPETPAPQLESLRRQLAELDQDIAHHNEFGGDSKEARAERREMEFQHIALTGQIARLEAELIAEGKR